MNTHPRGLLANCLRKGRPRRLLKKRIITMRKSAVRGASSFVVLARDCFLPSPKPGCGMIAFTYYTRRTGAALININVHMTRCDIMEEGFARYSEDNGRTWSAAMPWPLRFDHPKGIGRRDTFIGYADPTADRFLLLGNEAYYPNDWAGDHFKTMRLCYRVSTDGARTWAVDEPVIHTGPGYDENHPLPDVVRGENCIMSGDLGCRPLMRSDGVILMPIQSSLRNLPPGVDLKKVGSFTDCLVLMGRWQADNRLTWTSSERVKGDPEKSTRGWIEPTLAFLADGTILMVMRGSNAGRPDLPGYRWVARSRDGGLTWSQPVPWTYDDGTPFFSPSSCSQLVPYHDGRLFWVGNISQNNPTGNFPRFPLVIGEVDLTNGLLLKSTVTVVGDQHAGECPHVTISNFLAREDRETGDLVVHTPRFFLHHISASPSGEPDMTADSWLYRVRVR